MSGRLTLRMVATLLLLTGVGWVTGTLPWPLASDTPQLQSASQASPRVETTADPAFAADFGSAAGLGSAAASTEGSASYQLTVDAADDIDEPGVFDDEFSDDEFGTEDDNELSADLRAPMA